jgi:hypothetical protein
MKKVFLLTLYCLVLAGLLSPVYAATSTESQGQGLSVNPAILELILDPGKTTTSTVIVGNPTNVPIPVKGSVKNFIPNEEISQTDNNLFQAQSWFKLSEPDFILQPQQTKKITITVTTPADASPGGHYATVYFQSLIPAEAVSSDRLYLTGRVGVLAFLVVKGDIKEEASIAQFTTSRLQQSGPVKFKLGIKNKGNVHVLPSGKIKIFDWRGKQIDEIPLRTGLVLPKTTREFELSWDRAGTVGSYSAKAEVSYGSEQQQLKSTEIRFWVLPWLPLILIFIIFIPLAWFSFKTRRRWRRAWTVLRGKRVD